MPVSQPGKASITLRCTAEEHKRITTNATVYGMSMSEYVRFVSLNAKISVKIKEVKPIGNY